MTGDSEQSLRTRVDKDERDQEDRLRLLLRKVLERLMQFIQKVLLEEGRLQMQVKEVARQWGSSLRTEEAIKDKSRKTMLHLVTEFQECVGKEQASVHSACSQLEYLRYLSDTLALQAKDLLSRSPQCFVNYPGDWFYNVAGGPRGSWEVVHRKLIPLLKSVVQALEDNRRGASCPEILLGLGLGEGSSSRSTLKVSEAPGEPLRTATSQDVAPPAVIPPAPPAWPTADHSQLPQEVQNRMFLEKHASEMVHLQLSLLAEEINMISCLHESSKHKRNLGMAHSQNLEVAQEWESLLLELAEHHRHAEEDLVQQQQEEITCVGLDPDQVVLKGGALFSLDETLQLLVLLHAHLQREHADPRAPVAAERSETHLEGKFGAGLVAQRMRTAAVKMLKEEAAKQVWTYRVLDCYSRFQRRTCPEDVLQALDSLCYQVTGETVAWDVAQSAEAEQVEKAVNFIQERQADGDPRACFRGREEADLRKLRVQIQMELQAQIEEKVEAKEREVMQEAAERLAGLPAEHVTYFLLTQRHLRQAVLVLAGGLALQIAGPTAPGVLDEPLEDDDMDAVAQLVEARKGCRRLLLELQQAARMLRLRERQLQEMVRMLGAQPSDKGTAERQVPSCCPHRPGLRGTKATRGLQGPATSPPAGYGYLGHA
ncbi:uncharacterized protein LOC123036848 [Varanus komodoensis]|uniref:uncharacterized protein LOC123036848 n=1 Tax=Varanus komodoensis TaxID=61221 RepID=UPI001CF7AEA0|nr:uncharacterized protein LOC123036848 [Varanus komodoensis]